MKETHPPICHNCSSMKIGCKIVYFFPNANIKNNNSCFSECPANLNNGSPEKEIICQIANQYLNRN